MSAVEAEVGSRAERAEGCARRRVAVGAALGEHDVEALLVAGHANVRYLSGFSGSNGTLLVRPDGTAVLATDGRYDTQARSQVPGLGEQLRLVVGRGDEWLGGDGVLDGVRCLGLDAAHLSLARATALREHLGEVATRELTGVVEAVRSVKDEVELATLGRACRLTVEAFEAMTAWLRPGLSERQVAHRLVGEMIDRGAEGSAFDVIVAAGLAGAEPHHSPGDAVLSHGDLVTVDAGAMVDGYRADCTRTYALGEPSAALRELYDVVAAAQRAGVAAVLAGAPAASVDAACVAVCRAAGHGAHVAHPSGHGLGLDVHEEPILHARQVATLRVGTVITVEPGLYIPGVGGVRIEDVVAVTDEGPQVLTVPPAPGDPAAQPPVTARTLVVLDG